MDDDFPDDLMRLAEAFVFASPEPVTERALGRVLLVEGGLIRPCGRRE